MRWATVFPSLPTQVKPQLWNLFFNFIISCNMPLMSLLICPPLQASIRAKLSDSKNTREIPRDTANSIAIRRAKASAQSGYTAKIMPEEAASSFPLPFSNCKTSKTFPCIRVESCIRIAFQCITQRRTPLNQKPCGGGPSSGGWWVYQGLQLREERAGPVNYLYRWRSFVLVTHFISHLPNVP